jgi:serine/threonine protein kinase
MALKWYITPPDEKFYKNLERNIRQGAPSDAFIWPEYLTLQENGSYGYIMKLRPNDYFEFGNYLLARKNFKSFNAMMAAAMKICNGFMMLHRFGYSYQDLNDGNFFIRPTDGDVLICDNDNVMPQGEKSGIMGKARYMAPEIVAGGIPDKRSDRFSLSVILFMLFYANHPFEGARVVACPCMTESFERKFYGSEAIFVYDPTNNTNRPVRGIHQNVIRRWPVFPSILRETFEREFSQEYLQNPEKRMIEQNWEKIISQVRDQLVICPTCQEETFVETNGSRGKCVNRGCTIDISKRLLINNRSLPLTDKTEIYIDNDNTPDAVVSKDANGVLLIKNISPDKWTVETPSGKVKTVEPQDIMPVKEGLKITFKIREIPYRGEITNI